MASTANSNFATETLLQKGDGAQAYIVNSGSDNTPVVAGIVTFDAAPVVPAGLLVATQAVTAQAAGTSVTISNIFPADAAGTYLLTFTCSSPGQGLNLTGVGRVVKVGNTIIECIGFTSYAVQAALAGGAVSLIAFQNIIGAPSVVQLRNDANVPITGTLTLYKIASSN
jgi:hypothetical protein